MDDTAASPPARIKAPSSRGARSAFGLSLLVPLVYYFLGNGWTLLLGGAAAAWAGTVFVQGIVHPRIYLGKRWALAALALGGAMTYLSMGNVMQEFLWRRSFQLTEEMAVFEDPVSKWTVSYPVLWGHVEQRVSGTVNHLFRPSKVTPAMSFSVTCRPNVGTQDLALVVEGFFMNLPKGAQTEILEKDAVAYPTGHQGFRAVYTDLSRRIPLKTEVLFLLDEGRLYFLSAQATPRWFDRHRPYLEKLLYSLQFPPSPS